MNESQEKLLAEFDSATVAQWRALAEAELKGADFEKRLLTRTPEGITIQPLYTQADLPSGLDDAPVGKEHAEDSTFSNKPWGIAQEIVCSTPSEFNQQAKEDIAGGAHCITLHLDAASRAALDPDMATPDLIGRGGVSIATVEDVARAFQGLDLRKNPLFVRTGGAALAFSALLFAWMKKNGRKPSDLTGCIEMDPLGVLSHEGALPFTLEHAYQEMASLTKWSVENAPHLRTICVHARAWHEAGGSAVQELAFSMATAVEYLRAMQSHDLSVNVVAPRMRFTFAIGSDFFMEIAKFRAARRLWAGVVEAFGGSEKSKSMDLHGHTSRYNKTLCDPYVNLLRTTTEAFAGALGGCDTLAVAPFDQILRQPDSLSRRLARNIQIILQEESSIGQVVDATGGAYYVESLTSSLAEKAWALFQKIEAEGGIAQSLKRGTVQQMAATVADARLKDVAKRKKILVGTNMYAAPDEKPLPPRPIDHVSLHNARSRQVADYRTSSSTERDTVILETLGHLLASGFDTTMEAAIEAASAGATLGEIARALPWRGREHTVGVPVCIHRAARSYELLRQAASNFESGQPTVFLAKLGAPKDHRARADFSAGFFAPGGFKVIHSDPLTDAASATRAIRQSGAHVVVLCSSDAAYPEWVPVIARGLAGSNIVPVVAGRPGEHEEEWKQAGIRHFIYLGADTVAILKSILMQMGATL